MEAKRDQNYVTTLMAVTDDANLTPTNLIVDATTKRLKVSATITSGAISSLNGLTATTQTFAVGTSGSDFNISSVTSTHTFNIPDASATARGVVTTGAQTFAGAKTFSSTIVGSVNGTAATVTGATQAAITSAANLATVGTITSGIWNAGAVTSTGSFISTVSGGATFQNVSGGTNFQFIRLASTGADAYWGTEGSSAGAFFTSAAAYATVLYTSTTQQFIIGGAQVLALQSGSRNMVLGTTDAQVTSRTGNTLRAPNVATGGAGNIAGASVTYAVGLGTGTGAVGSHIFQTAAVAAAGDNIQALSTTMTITAGKVGIGIAIPAATLHVSSSDSSTIISASGDTKGVRIGTTSTGGTIDGVDSTLSASYQPLAVNASYISLGNSGTEAMRITGGNIVVGGSASASELRFLEPSGSGTNYTAFKAQAQAGNVVYTLPAADGSSGQFLSTNASGTLSWATAGGGAATVLTLMPTCNQVPAGGDATKAIVTSTTGHLGQINVTQKIVVNQVTFDVSVAAVAGTAKVVLYSEDGQTQIFSVTTATISGAGVVSTAVSSVTVNPGIYYLYIMPVSTASFTCYIWGTNTTSRADFTALSGKAVMEGTLTVTADTPPTTFTPSSITSAALNTLLVRLDG